MPSGNRLYIGRLTPDVRESDLEDLFKGYGKITDLRLMGTFGFVEWERLEDAEDVMKDFDGKTFMGDKLKIEFAKESRKNQAARQGYGPPPPGYGGGYGGGPPPGYGGYYDYYGGGPPGGGYGPPPGGRGGYGPPPPGYGPPPGGRREPNPRRGQFRLIVSNLPSNTSWQDLKDLGREYGRISFADVDASRPEEGVIEYDNREDYDRALEGVEGMELRGNKLRIDPAERGGPPRGGGGGGRDGRDGGSRRGGSAAAPGGSVPPADDRPPPPARDRSRSPAPRRRDDDREPPPQRRFDSRSPPPRRERDFD